MLQRVRASYTFAQHCFDFCLLARVLQPASLKSLPTQWSEDYIPTEDSNVTPSAANSYRDPAVRFQPRRTVSVGPVGSASGTGGTRLSQS